MIGIIVEPAVGAPAVWAQLPPGVTIGLPQFIPATGVGVTEGMVHVGIGDTDGALVELAIGVPVFMVLFGL